MQRNIASSSRNLEGLTKRVSSETSDLSSTTEAYRMAASTHHANLYDATQSLIENGLKEDTPTGTTPRKRRWDYIDEWSLTESRDILLKKWRRQGQSSARTETLPAEHLPPAAAEELEDEPEEPLPEEEKETNEVEDVKMDDGENVPPTSSPPLTSVSSSNSLTPILSVPDPVPKRKTSEFLRSGLPTMGTLTERSTNIVVNRRRALR